MSLIERTQAVGWADALRGAAAEMITDPARGAEILRDLAEAIAAGLATDPDDTRDPEHPCEAWAPGPPMPGADCETDGHHRCRECSRNAGRAGEDGER